ncbi:hypothetical protein ACFPM0_05495 [Pseudonocardia sulfidoxydans]
MSGDSRYSDYRHSRPVWRSRSGGPGPAGAGRRATGLPGGPEIMAG